MSSQIKGSKYNVRIKLSNNVDTTIIFNTKEEYLNFYKSYKEKISEFQNKTKKVYLKMELIEQEFKKLYLRYQDSVFHTKKEYGIFLDSLSHCQLNYLKNIDKNYISHEQNNFKFETLTDRFNFFYKTKNGKYAEVLALIPNGDNELQIAKNMFEGWLSSKNHKEIIDNKIYKFYNFKFGYNKFGKIVGIGIFSQYEETLK